MISKIWRNQFEFGPVHNNPPHADRSFLDRHSLIAHTSVMDDNDDQLGGAGEACSATPLLFLLDGLLSQDEQRVDEAVEEISSMGCEVPEDSPCNSKSALCQVLTSLLDIYPELASMSSNHDGSLPLHFAASLGYVPAAAIVLSKVSLIGI